MMRSYQAGGGVEEDEEEVTTVDKIIERTTGAGPQPNLTSMITTRKVDALNMLRDARKNFQERSKRARTEAERAKWLAFAQGMLAPTRTGGFGESVGTTAGLLRQEQALRQKMEGQLAEEETALLGEELDVTDTEIDQLLDMYGSQTGAVSAGRPRVMGTQIMMDPDDAAAIERGEKQPHEAQYVWVTSALNPDGTRSTVIEKDRSGRPLRPADPRRIPGQAATMRTAEDVAAASAKQVIDTASQGVKLIPYVKRYQEAYKILQGLREDTSGLRSQMLRVAEYLGITELMDDSVDLARLRKYFGSQVLKDLRLLTGTKTNFEYQKVEDQNANLGKSVEQDLAVLKDNIAIAMGAIDKGEYAARQLGEGPGGENKEFWLDLYGQFRTQQERAEQEYAVESRRPPPDAISELMRRAQQNEGNAAELKFLLDSFTEYYDIPEADQLELRRLGAPI